MEKENKKRGVKVLIISIIIVLILALALSYAYFRTELNGSDQIVKVGELELVLDETSEGISLNNTVGISDEEGLSLTPSTFKLINNGNKAVDYIIYLDDNEISDTDTRIDDKYLKYNLNKNGENSGATLLTSIGSNPNRILDYGTIEGKGTNEYSLGLWITDEVDGNYSNQVFSGKLRVEVSQARPTAVSVIKAKANAEDLNYNDATEEQKNEMWTFSHEATEQTEALTDYRYIGSNPNNYVIFNDELWRIIGVFTVDDGTGKKEERLKIIREEPIGNYSWDNKNVDTGAENAYGKNKWIEARINYLLNSEHESENIGGSLYWNSGSGMCYYGQNNGTISCDFTTIGLDIEARNMIGDGLWYLGGTSSYTSSINGLASHFYAYERGTTVYAGRDTYWVGKVGLLYLSDYGYATSGGNVTDRTICLNKELYNWDDSNYSDCKNNNWLYESNYCQWILTSQSSSSHGVFRVRTSGSFDSHGAFQSCMIRPVVYLKSNIKIAIGDGSSSNPYRLY